MTSLRTRLLTWLVGLLLVVGAAGVFGTYLVAVNEPNEDFDNQLRQLAFYVGEGSEQSYARTGEGSDLEFEDSILVQIWDGTGRPARLSDPTIPLPRQDRTGFADLQADGHAWRTYTLVRPTRTVQISQRSEIRRDLAAQDAFRVAYPIAALIPLSTVLLVLTVSRILRPLRRLTDDLQKREAGAHTPLPLAGLPSEVAPLVRAMNALLARQHELLEFRQCFLSDAAHQLRTPLTAARLQAGNLRHAPAVDVVDLAEDIERALKRMSEMIGQLLRLARAEAPDRAGPTSNFDLAEIAAQAISDVLALADTRSIDLGMTERMSAFIRCDADEVRMLIGNLLDNAVRYTPSGGMVDVAVRKTESIATITVSDSGPGLSEPDLQRLFGRFVRLGRADAEGSGLGLAIVKAIATRHGGDIRIGNKEDLSGLLVTVAFPVPS